ncbi:hypothetical protein A3L14_06605 [Thermococcus thioreducens]|uniref:Uncharacterized protein n=1 Tax=Thermococcus thioreducens TaxID=277988 RepID=A0A0Q2M3B9_9EURY|nr:hypothetical protein A3L14_06605 [Thermococcus thioreducens]KQH82426.1 hypothetical protein AMR53_05635 [Thermococcus thioreducens]
MDRKVYAISGKVEPEDLEHPRITGYLTKKFDEVINEDNIPKLAKTWVEGLREAGIYGVSEEEVEQYMRKVLKLSKKIKKELHGDRVSTHDLGKENPMIWSALNIKEFRQFLAEISGKKIEPEKPKFPETKKAVENAPTDIKLEVQKLLGVLNGLKYADYSQKAVEKAPKELEAEIEKLIEEKNLELIGVYSTVALLLRKGEFEEAREFLKGIDP